MNTPIHAMLDMDEFYDDDTRGISCQFIPMTDTIGLKLYWNADEGRKAYAMQKLASFHGLGPKCYKRFTFRYGFGYFTEIVEILSEDEWNDEYGYYYRINSSRHPYHDIFLELKKIGIIDTDGHHKNYGRNTDGKLMLVDFGGYGINTVYKKKQRRGFLTKG